MNYGLPKGYEAQFHNPTHPGWTWWRPKVSVDFKGPSARWGAPGWVSAGAFNPKVWIS